MMDIPSAMVGYGSMEACEELNAINNKDFGF